jgi:hypothetical protein
VRLPLAAASAALLSLSLAAAPARAAEPAAVEVKPTGTKGQAAAERTETFTATVKAVDAAARTVTLEWKGGQTGAFQVGPEVKGLGEVRAGDTVRIDVVQRLQLEVQAKGSPNVPLTVGSGATGVTGIQGTVMVTGVDRSRRLVRFQDAAGATYEVKAGPGLALEQLEAGERLLATFVEAMAVKLEKEPR